MKETRTIVVPAAKLQTESGRIDLIRQLNEAFRAVYTCKHIPGIIGVTMQEDVATLTVGCAYSKDDRMGQYGRLLTKRREVACTLESVLIGDPFQLAHVLNDGMLKVFDGKTCPALHFSYSYMERTFMVVVASRELSPEDVPAATKLFLHETDEESPEWSILFVDGYRLADAVPE